MKLTGEDWFIHFGDDAVSALFTIEATMGVSRDTAVNLAVETFAQILGGKPGQELEIRYGDDFSRTVHFH